MPQPPNRYTTRIQKGGALLEEMRQLVLLWSDAPIAENRAEVIRSNPLNKATRARIADILNRIFIPRFVEGPIPNAWKLLRPLEELSPSLSTVRPIYFWLTALAEPLIAALPALNERDWQGEIAYPAAQGQLTLLTRASQIAQTGPGVYVVVFDDITRLLRAQRQAAWGEVARRLAHEIKNPLTPIQLSAERLQHRLHGKLDAMDGDMLSRLTQTIVNQVSALNSMVDAFSQYARSPEAELSPVDLGILTREVLGLYESMGWAMALSVEPRLPQVLGDATKLRQVLHNLLRNAEDAVGASSLPRISVRLGRFEGGVALSVTDNGNGFPPELMGSAFEPYVTTKPKGTGLGLAIVHKIVEEHHGTILLENIEPHGAKVTVVLPATAATARIGANTGSAAHG